jgi:N utilization substance protein A
MLAQLLASEGFDSIEEIAYVAPEEIAMIEGLDDETASEIQARATEYLDKQAAELEAKRKELGVKDDLASFEGLTPAMLVMLGEDGIYTLEDFAGCIPDDLVGWSERKDGETVRHEGTLSATDMSAAEAEELIMRARLQLGWIEPEPEPEPESEAGLEEGEAAGGEAAAETGEA